jgi:hypothetical protein
VNQRAGIGLLVAVGGLFIGAVLLGLHGGTPIRFVGLFVLGAGLLAALFSAAIAAGQKELAERPYIPQHWEGVRPLTVRLWGIGVSVLGILMLLGALG